MFHVKHVLADCISFASPCKGKAHSFRRSSSPKCTRCAGLHFGIACGRVGMISPCGATYFARVGKVGKTPPGDGVWKNTPCFYAASPGPPDMFTGEASRRWKVSIRRGKSPGCVSVRRPLPLRSSCITTCFYKKNRACLSALAEGLGWTAPSPGRNWIGGNLL